MVDKAKTNSIYHFLEGRDTNLYTPLPMAGLAFGHPVAKYDKSGFFLVFSTIYSFELWGLTPLLLETLVWRQFYLILVKAGIWGL